MSYTTVEVELENGRIWTRGSVALPAKAHALLTILEPKDETPRVSDGPTGAGLRRFLSTPDFALTPEQFRASMDADFFEQ
ncbi:MAG TPA: hypothetical protein P5186_06315 [Candidatus Paceibacterota bacterium]|nr:hypothetical protein [Candidatus Paceibacterota bacterium]